MKAAGGKSISETTSTSSNSKQLIAAERVVGGIKDNGPKLGDIKGDEMDTLKPKREVHSL